MTAPTVEVPRIRRVRRAPALVAFAALVAVAVVAGPGSGRTPREVVGPAEAVAMPPGDARSIAWYCAGGPVALRDTDGVSELAAGDEVLHIANLSGDLEPVRVTVFADGEEVAVTRREVAPHSTLRLPLRDLTDAARPAAVVEAFSGQVAVGHAVRGSEGAAGPCSTEPSGRWYFPTGTTVAGTRQWLTLFNPFGDDAIVDIVWDTSSGRRQPERYVGFVVPRRSRVTIPVHDTIRREEAVATTIVARTGRVVAEQSVDAVEGGPGTTLTLGAVAAAPTWVLAGGYGGDGVTRSIAVMNPGDVDVEVDVRGLATGDAIVEPRTEVVPRRSTKVMDVTGLAAGFHGLVVDTGSNRGVVVGDLTRWSDAGLGRDTATGWSASVGSVRPSDAWIVASARPFGQARLRLVVANPGVDEARVGVELHVDGAVQRPEQAQDVGVGPGRVAVLTVSVPGADAAVRVTATADVVVDALVVGDGVVSVAAAIPPTPQVDPFDVSETTTTTTVLAPTTTTTTTTTTSTATTTTTTTRPPRTTTTERDGAGPGRTTTTDRTTTSVRRTTTTGG